MAYFSGKISLKPVDPDKLKIEKSALVSGTYVFDLELDSAPDHNWILAFEAELHASRYMSARSQVLATDHEPNQEWLNSLYDGVNEATDY